MHVPWGPPYIPSFLQHAMHMHTSSTFPYEAAIDRILPLAPSVPMAMPNPSPVTSGDLAWPMAKEGEQPGKRGLRSEGFCTKKWPKNFVPFTYRGGGFRTGVFSHKKILHRVYFAQWPENPAGNFAPFQDCTVC